MEAYGTVMSMVAWQFAWKKVHWRPTAKFTSIKPTFELGDIFWGGVSFRNVTRNCLKSADHSATIKCIEADASHFLFTSDNHVMLGRNIKFTIACANKVFLLYNFSKLVNIRFCFFQKLLRAYQWGRHFDSVGTYRELINGKDFILRSAFQF
jgi:hypothetical protein